MSTFKEYADLFELHCDAELLDIIINDSGFSIFNGSAPLLTPGGNSFTHASEGMIRLIVTDIHLLKDSSLKEFSSAVLYSFSRDILIPGKRTLLSEEWEKQLSDDPFVLIKNNGKTSLQPFHYDHPLFSFSFISISGLIGIVNEFISEVLGELNVDDNDSQPFHDILRLSYDRLSADQKVAFHALSGVHHGGIVLPLLLILGKISSVEYVKGLISLKLQSAESFSETLAGVARIQTYLGYLTHKQHNERRVSEMINAGEGDSVEFKSTLRWDIRAGKTNPAIERSCLKTISAFVNSAGGTLLIGVRDDGSIEGIETDKFANEDKFLLHLWTLIRNCLGRDFSPYIRTRIEKIEDKNICAVDCIPANRPVFLRQPGFDEEMYIRLGPSSNALDISEALKYIEDHFVRRS